MQNIVISKNQAGQRLDKFLNKYLPNAGSSFLYKMLRKKNITLNGKKAEGKEILVIGDVVTSFFSDETFAKFSGSNENLNNKTETCDNNTANYVNVSNDEYIKAYKSLKNIKVVYEDDDIVVLDKPAGVLSQKAETDDISLNEWLVGYLLDKGTVSEEDLKTFHPSVCNRLDRNTSGIVMCGKSLSGLQFLSDIIKNREVHKFYRTICIGEIKKDITLEGYLSKNKSTNTVKVSFEGKNSQDSPIKTAIHPISYDNDKNSSYLEVQLFTGKTHQIRSHLSSIGHPIIGDAKYGDAEANKYYRNKYGLKYQLLHAYRIEFPEKFHDDMPEKYREKYAYLQGRVLTADIPDIFKKIL
jgi:23S rRNA pseudouridine955/2504/2580 synthase